MDAHGGADSAGPDDPRLVLVGRIEVPGITTYQYGSHVLVGDGGEAIAALRAATPGALDGVVGRRARVAGRFVVGYPLDLGPPLLEVDGIADA